MDYSFNIIPLDCGVQVCEARSPKFKTAVISISLSQQLSSRNSAYALVANMLLRSSAEYGSFKEISEKLAELYGAQLSCDVTKQGEQLVLSFSMSFIGDRFALEGESICSDCMRLLLSLLLKPNLGEDGCFDRAELESEKRILIERLESEMNDKAVYARNRLDRIMCENELYGMSRFGTASDIEAVTPESAAAAYRELMRSSVIRINLMGDVDAAAVIRMINDGFSSLERVPASLFTRFVPRADEVKYVKETDSVKQGKLVMGYRAGMNGPDDSYFAVRVMTDLFGGSPHSKLFKVVREKMSLCYYCSARVVRQKGIIYVQSGIECENEEKARAAIEEQLDAARRGEFSDEDLKASVDALCDAFGSLGDTPEMLDAWFGQFSGNSLPVRPEEYIGNIKNVTRDEVIRAARAVTLDTVYMLSGGEEQE